MSNEDVRYRPYFSQDEVQDALVCGIIMGLILGVGFASIIWWAAT